MIRGFPLLVLNALDKVYIQTMFSETFVISRLIVPYISPMVVGFIYGTCIVGFSSSSILAPHTIIFSIAFVQHLWRELSAEVQSFDGFEFQVDITESAESFFFTPFTIFCTFIKGISYGIITEYAK